jgi:DNA-binding transcriptional LysR family regulator
MELSDLTVFAAVARCGGITRAAGELNTVQSNVTTRVQVLEAEIGLPLFERHNRGVRLTDAGKRLLPYAERLAVISREAILAARDDGCPKGPLLIGSMETTAAVRLPPVLARFHRKFPQVQLSLQTGPTAALMQDVIDGTLDGIIGCVSADMGITLLPRAVAERADFRGGIRAHTLTHPQRRVDTLFVRHTGRRYGSALESLVTCVTSAKADDIGRPTRVAMRPTGHPTTLAGASRAARRQE